jgi:hypothetical protein
MKRYRVGLGAEGVTLWHVTVEAPCIMDAEYIARAMMPSWQFCDYTGHPKLIKKADYDKYPLTKSITRKDGCVVVNY